MKCNFCKKEVEHNMKFCPYCGNPIDHKTPLDEYLQDENQAQKGGGDKIDSIFKSYEQSINKTKPQNQRPSNHKSEINEPIKNRDNYKNFEMPKIFNPDNVDEDLNVTGGGAKISNKHKADISDRLVVDKHERKKFDSNAVKENKFQRNTDDLDEAEHNGSMNIRKSENDKEQIFTMSDTGVYEKKLNIPRSYGVSRTGGGGRKKVIIISAIAAIIILGVLGYFFLSGSQPELMQKITSIEAGTEVDLLSLVELERDDKFDISVKSGEIDTMAIGEYRVTYEVTNKKTDKGEDFEFMFRVVDNTPPQITGPESINVIKNAQFDVLENVTAFDTIDGDIDKSKITINGNIDATVKGTYPVTLSVTDKAGNKGTKTINIIVDDPNTFFNSINGVWKFEGNENQLLIIKKESSKYLMFIGHEQSEGFGGEFSFKTVSSDNKTASLIWSFEDEGGMHSLEVLIDTGISGDRKMKIDFGDGWENLIYFKKN